MCKIVSNGLKKLAAGGTFRAFVFGDLYLICIIPGD